MVNFMDATAAYTEIFLRGSTAPFEPLNLPLVTLAVPTIAPVVKSSDVSIRSQVSSNDLESLNTKIRTYIHTYIVTLYKYIATYSIYKLCTHTCMHMACMYVLVSFV